MQGIPETDATRLAANRRRVLATIDRAVESAGRPPGSCRLVAVTKAVPPAVVAHLLTLGQRDLGENRPEALTARRTALDPDGTRARWHLIGHYQRRKVRDTLAFCDLVHSVHSVELLEALALRSAALGRNSSILLQLGVSGEATKQGFPPGDLARVLEAAERHPSLSVQGLMTMAPFGVGPDAARRIFAALRDLRDRNATPERPLPELSMGMSGDFEAAVLEGATLVRVGTALFDGLGPAP